MKAGKVVRRVHLYAALFLMPWILMYSLSGLIMHHRMLIGEIFGREPYLINTLEREITYDAVFPEDAGHMVKAEQVLSDLGLSGRFNAHVRNDNGKLIINRNDILKPHRVEFNPADKSLKVFVGKAHPVPILTRLHHRLGYGNGSFWDNIWAFIVDAVIVAIFYWCISGVIMWLGMKPTRRLGIAFTAAGLVIFIACIAFI